MKQIIVDKNEANQTLIKLLHKYLKEAPDSFLYKMLRKKNIVLNGCKATGKEKLCIKDCITIYLSDETYNNFSGKEKTNSEYAYLAGLPLPDLEVVYEDDDILVINKPVGMLSQKAKPQDISANEYILAYCIQKGTLTEKEFLSFKPSVCNRLDRNTCGLLIAGKTLSGLQTTGAALKERRVEKYYYCIVHGLLTKKQYCKAYLSKDEAHNKVRIQDVQFAGSQPIETAYEPLLTNGTCSLLKVHLITGKTHQIRAHLSYLGLPIAGDPKYGDEAFNSYLRKKYRIHSQLLCAKEMHFSNGLHLQVDMPEDFKKVINGEHLI